MMEDIKIQTLGAKERKLLLKALDLSLDNMQCYYCEEKVDYKTCGIMPAIAHGETARIICDSPLCVCEYLEDLENSKEA